MKHTKNYNFNIPEDNDMYNKNYYNDNFETIDTEVQRLIDIVDGGSEVENETDNEPGA